VADPGQACARHGFLVTMQNYPVRQAFGPSTSPRQTWTDWMGIFPPAGFIPTSPVTQAGAYPLGRSLPGRDFLSPTGSDCAGERKHQIVTHPFFSYNTLL